MAEKTAERKMRRVDYAGVVIDTDDNHFQAAGYRTRNTDNECVIVLRVGDQALVFSSSKYGELYEEVAREAAEVLAALAEDPCLIGGEK